MSKTNRSNNNSGILDPKADAKHFSEKLYFFPESLHALRKEMQLNYPDDWAKIGGALAWNPVDFVAYMANKFKCFVQFDSENVDGICKRLLDECRVARGLSRLHNSSEYYLADSQLDTSRVVVEDGKILGTIGDLDAKREI